MKRRWIKILSILLASVSFILVVLIYIFTCLLFDKYNNEPSFYSTIFIDPFFESRLTLLILAAFLCMHINIGCVVLDSIDMCKTIDENGKIKYPLTLLIINSAIYLLALSYLPLLFME